MGRNSNHRVIDHDEYVHFLTLRPPPLTVLALSTDAVHTIRMDNRGAWCATGRQWMVSIVSDYGMFKEPCVQHLGLTHV